MPEISLSVKKTEMILQRLQTVNFKNIKVASLDFSEGVNCFLGLNGMGKSNLLETIHFLSLTRGFRTMSDAEFITHGMQQMFLKGEYLRDDGSSDILTAGISYGKRKILKCNGKEYPRLADHIGRFPVVVAEPRDSLIVTGSGDVRRRMLDMVISQADKKYLATLSVYNKALDARNRMIRSGIKDPLLFESVEKPLGETAAVIHSAREEWVERSIPLFSKYYARISGNHEEAKIHYRSSLNNCTLPELLEKNREKDLALGYTSAGPHRDDIEITLDGYNARKLGSQGQIKTLTIALKFAIYDWMCVTGNETPILLLDDIFDKLDARRVGNIMDEVATSPMFNQIFVTDTNRKHLDSIITGIKGSRMFEVESGNFSQIEK